MAIRRLSTLVIADRSATGVREYAALERLMVTTMKNSMGETFRATISCTTRKRRKGTDGSRKQRNC